MLDAAGAGHLIDIPFTTVTNIQNFYPETKAMPKGHIGQQRQGVRSSEAKALEYILEEEKAVSNIAHKDVYVGVWDLKYSTFSFCQLFTS